MIHVFVHSLWQRLPGLGVGVVVTSLVCLALVAGLAVWGIGVVLRGDPACPRRDEAQSTGDAGSSPPQTTSASGPTPPTLPTAAGETEAPGRTSP
jgi:hypothetical protein